MVGQLPNRSFALCPKGAATAEFGSRKWHHPAGIGGLLNRQHHGNRSFIANYPMRFVNCIDYRLEFMKPFTSLTIKNTILKKY
jgi:hypothetical protein